MVDQMMNIESKNEYKPLGALRYDKPRDKDQRILQIRKEIE